MDEQANVNVVKQCYAAFQAGDIASLKSYFAEDIDWELPAVPGVAFTGRRHGNARVMEFFEQMGAAQEAEVFEPMEYIAQGSRVVAMGHYKFKVRATGKHFASDWVHVFTVRDGRITALREFFDTHVAEAAYR
jgi:ketosteroid isomerase-like protein